jgi:radical SAM superfamily enzyme YgiQ (UPF0313 family)
MFEAKLRTERLLAEMKVLLVVPSQSDTYGKFLAPDYPSLGLAYLAAVLQKAGHIVKIIDIDADGVTQQDFAKELKVESYGVVGITTTTPTFNKAISLARLVKTNSKSTTVLGGIHVTVMPEESVGFDSVDFIVKGEGERTVVELMDYLQGRMGLDSIDGLYYRRNGNVIKNKDRDLISNLDELPFPARHLFNQQNYTYPDTLYKRAFPIITSRGCPANCTYCNSKNMFSRKFRFRSSENVAEEIEQLIKDYKAREIHIWDDNFTIRKDRVFQIRDQIKRRKIKVKFAFPNGLRADLVDEGILQALKDMGTYSIAFGVESGNQNILDRVNKNLKLEQIKEAFRLARRVGLETWAFFMIGLPGETQETIKDTVNFAIKLNPDVAKFHILKPFPGSQVYNELKEQGLLLDADFSHYGIHTPPVHRLRDLQPQDLLDWHRQAYRSFYLRPSIFVKQLLRLKSLNRLKLNLQAAYGVLKSILCSKRNSEQKREIKFR